MASIIWTALIAAVAGIAWALAIRRSQRRATAADGSGDAREGIIVFVEPVRWLFVIWGFAAFCDGLRRGGCRHQLRLFRWSGMAGALLVLPDLMRRGRLLAKAERLARFVEEIGREIPGRTVHLCGYSTGCFLAVEAVQRLNRDVRIGNVVLLAGTFSPRYELDSLAGRGTRVYNFFSGMDFVINGLGPVLFGSNDRQFAPACGMVGLHAPPAFVSQRAWSRPDIASGYFGDHFTITAPRFVARTIAPLFVDGTRNDPR